MADLVARRRPLGVRGRTTAIAVVAVALVLAAAAAGIVTFTERTLVDEARDVVNARLAEIALEPNLVRIPQGADDEFVQVVRDGAVVSSTENVRGRPPAADLDDGGEAIVDAVIAEEGPHLVVAEVTDGTSLLVGRSLDDVVEATSAATRSLAVAVPIVVAVVGLMTWLLVGRALRPIDAMRAEADRISASDLYRRLPDDGARDEVGRLAGTLNRMLERLEEAQQRQRRFVSDASHELRSPIAAIRQHAEVIRADAPARVLAEEILPEAARLQSLVDDLLVLARLDEGATEPFVEVDLDDLVLAEAARLRDGGTVAVDTTGIRAARVRGNASQLSRVFRNLSDNAARHAVSRVVVAVDSADGIATVIVDDDGPGVPEHERERVLERFVRLDEGRGRREGGAGLGLAIVSEVLRAHGGRIDLGDSPLGGLRATVRLRAAD